MRKTQKFGLSQKTGPMFEDFLVKNGTLVYEFLVMKVTHYSGISPFALLCEYPHPRAFNKLTYDDKIA